MACTGYGTGNLILCSVMLYENYPENRVSLFASLPRYVKNKDMLCKPPASHLALEPHFGQKLRKHHFTNANQYICEHWNRSRQQKPVRSTLLQKINNDCATGRDI